MRVLTILIICLLLTPATMAATPVSAPTTMPAPDYSSPVAIYISLQKLLLAGDLDAYVECGTPAASDDQRDALRASAASTVIACALVDHFGTNVPFNYAAIANTPRDLIEQARTAQQTIHGGVAELVLTAPNAGGRMSPSLRSVGFQQFNDQWRMNQNLSTPGDQQHAVSKSEIEFAQRILAGLRSGKIHDMAEFEKEQAFHASALRTVYRIPPVFIAPNLDPAGLRVKPAAIPADKSDDHAFHVDIVLENTGPSEINVLLGRTNVYPGSLNPPVHFNENATLEAVDKNGTPITIAMQRGAYGGPPLIPWIITIKPGESFSMRPEIPFGAPKPPTTPSRPPPPGRPNVTIPPYFLPPGTYTFTATVISNQVHEQRQPGDLFRDSELPRPGLFTAKMPIWTGTVVSEPVIITIPAPPSSAAH